MILVVSTIVKVWAAHGEQCLIEISPKIPSVPDTLNMSAPQGVAGRVIIGWDIDPGGFPDDARSGKADARGSDGELVW